MAGKMKKGALVRILKEQLVNSVEATASDSRFPSYLFESKGEVLDIDGDYAFVKFYVPTPSIWFKLDQLELVD